MVGEIHVADQGVEDFASCKFGPAQNEHHAGAVVGEVAFHVGEGDAVGSSDVFGFRVVENSEPDGERGRVLGENKNLGYPNGYPRFFLKT